MFVFAEVTENGIVSWNIHLLSLLSSSDCYLRDTQKGYVLTSEDKKQMTEIHLFLF